jgi:molybdopterin/thiamine biosynthesis adenylyltransferase
MKLRIAEFHYNKMRSLLAPSFLDGKRARPETGCVLLVARNDHLANSALLVADLIEPAPGDFDRQSDSALSFSSQYLRRALLAVRRRGLAGFLTAHTHPLSDRTVGFSWYDDANDPELMANLFDLQPGGTFGSIVLGKRSMKARLWTPDLRSLDMDEMTIIGSRYLSIPLNGVGHERAPQPAAIFDRGLAISGAGALYQMSRMRFGIVGISGTGSILLELLVRAGAGTVVLFEFDSIDETNLNRILHSRRRDAVGRIHKTVRAEEVTDETGLPTKVVVIEGGDIRDASVADDLRGCDVLFGCVDREWPRLILSEVAYQYLVPVIDMGTEVGMAAEGAELQSLDARVSYVVPGNPCLSCAGLVSSEGLRLEGLSEEELERTIGLGYCRDIRMKAPAVMDLNMRASSLATLLLRHLLQPFMVTPLPTSIRESLTNLTIKSRFEQAHSDCLICGSQGRLGSGSRFRLSTREDKLNGHSTPAVG